MYKNLLPAGMHCFYGILQREDVGIQAKNDFDPGSLGCFHLSGISYSCYDHIFTAYLVIVLMTANSAYPKTGLRCSFHYAFSVATTLLPNTSGARNAKEAVRIARLARELGCGNFVKVEIMRDSKYLLPDNQETIKATEILAKEGFVVMPYMYPDLNVARDLVNAGAASVMPLASPIGSNKGLATKEFIQILVDEIDLPIIVDAGIGRPSQACEAMEMGAAAIMANTALATAGDLPMMASAFKNAIEAGRKAYLAGLGRVLTRGASASDPLTGFLRD